MSSFKLVDLFLKDCSGSLFISEHYIYCQDTQLVHHAKDDPESMCCYELASIAGMSYEQFEKAQASSVKGKGPFYLFHTGFGFVLVLVQPHCSDSLSYEKPPPYFKLDEIAEIQTRSKKPRIAPTIIDMMLEDSDVTDIPTCEQIEKSVAWMKKKGIKSKIAMFNILFACHSNTFVITMQEATQRWIEEIRKMRVIHEKAQNFSPDLLQQNTYFALHTLILLQFGDLDITDLGYEMQVPACPYADDARNFIVTLLKTGKCLCACYTNYVLAAAEEFGYTLICKCVHEGAAHCNIAITYPKGDQDPTIDLQDKVCIKGPFDYCSKRTIQLSRIYAILDSGFRTNEYIKVTSVHKSQTFKKLYLGKQDSSIIRVIRNEDIQCPSNSPFTNSKWSFIAANLSYMALRRNKTIERFKTSLNIIIAIWGKAFAHLPILLDLIVTRTTPDNLEKEQDAVAKIIQDIKHFSEEINDYPNSREMFIICFFTYAFLGVKYPW
jgi:hypothetical protein